MIARATRRFGVLSAALITAFAALLMTAGAAHAVSTQYMTYANGRCTHVPVYGYQLPEGSVYNDYTAGGYLTQPRVVTNNTPNWIVFHLGVRPGTSGPYSNWGSPIIMAPYTSYQLSASMFGYIDWRRWILNFYTDTTSGHRIGYCYGVSV